MEPKSVGGDVAQKHGEIGSRSGGPLPPFAALRAFDAVFRVGGIRKAAMQLGVNHAVVSRHIKQLEDWLGVPLVARNGNRLLLTEEGARYHTRIASAFAEMQLATDELIGLRDSAPLRLHCVPGLSIQWLSGQLAAFERAYPECRVELKPTDAPANLAIHEADADIRYHRDDDPEPSGGRGLRCFDLARPAILAVASPAMAANLNARADEILEWPFLHEEDDREWRAWLRLNGVTPPQKLPGLLCWHAHLAIDAARQGRGVALASRFLIETDLIAGSLAPIRLPEFHTVPLGGYVLTAREDRWSNPILARLRDFLRTHAALLESDHG